MVHRDIVQTEEFKEKYPLLAAYVSPVRKPEREVLGRDYEKVLVKAGLARPELSNILLLAQAGAGKSTLVEAVAEEDTSALYLEVDVALMISDLRMQEELASIIKKIFDEAEAFVDDEKIELVLFMDEFHQLVQISKSAVEAIKPVLAQSGTRGIKVIAATTYEEFHQWIAPNQPLMERLQRVNLSPPDKKTTISILEGAAQRYEVSHLVRDPQLYELIYEYTNRYQPSSEQPRKSILLLDAMLGWHFETGRAMDVSLLHDVLEQSTGIKVDFRVDATKIKAQLDSKVFAQDLATKQVERRLHLTVADLQDQTKPKSSMLFSGATGTGKTELTKQLAHLLFGDASRHLIRFDMSEFSQHDSLDFFRNELSKAVWNTGHAIVLLDEIEKADPNIIRLLLQVLDDGRLTDMHGRTVSFLNTYIIMTTNAASEIYRVISQYDADDDGSGLPMEDRMKEIRRSLTETGDFPPELLGRIDTIVPFQPLSEATMVKVVTAAMKKKVLEIWEKHRVKVGVDKKVITYLIEDRTATDSNEGGARQVLNKMAEEFTTELAKYINTYPTEKDVWVDVAGEMRAGDKTALKSRARITVGKRIAR